jgi:phage/plasmid-like protein (TIGR03299 family)
MKNDHTISSEHLSAIDLLGTRVEGTFTAEDAMTKGQLGGWNVRKVPAFAFVDGKKISKDGMYDIVRDNPGTGRPDVLSRYSVGSSYEAVQNEAHAEFLNTLVEESGANFELAGSLDGGRKVFISMKLPGHIQIGGVDPIDLSLLALNAHDGSMSFTLTPMPVRYACSNIMNAGMPLMRIRHTSGAHRNMVSKARETLEITFNNLDVFQAEAERMINTTLTQQRFEQIIAKEFGAPEDAAAAAVTRAEKKLDQMAELFADASTQDGIRQTAWAGYNALTEWSDHFAPSRGEDRDASRAQRAILDPSFKERARQLMLAVV